MDLERNFRDAESRAYQAQHRALHAWSTASVALIALGASFICCCVLWWAGPR